MSALLLNSQSICYCSHIITLLITLFDRNRKKQQIWFAEEIFTWFSHILIMHWNCRNLITLWNHLGIQQIAQSTFSLACNVVKIIREKVRLNFSHFIPQKIRSFISKINGSVTLYVQKKYFPDSISKEMRKLRS
jgi:hypothetical protein